MHADSNSASPGRALQFPLCTVRIKGLANPKFALGQFSVPSPRLNAELSLPLPPNPCRMEGWEWVARKLLPTVGTRVRGSPCKAEFSPQSFNPACHVHVTTLASRLLSSRDVFTRWFMVNFLVLNMICNLRVLSSCYGSLEDELVPCIIFLLLSLPRP